MVNTWIGFHAQNAGYSLDAIPDEWVDALLASSATMDSGLFESASSEAMYRKACVGEFKAAGLMLRGYLKHIAKAVVDQRYILIGIKQTQGRKKGGEKAARQKKSDALAWQSKCVHKARQMLREGTKPRELAGKLAQLFDRTDRQIRDVLKKAEVK